MTPDTDRRLDLEAIRGRYRRARHPNASWREIKQSEANIPALLAEVERLRAAGFEDRRVAFDAGYHSGYYDGACGNSRVSCYEQWDEEVWSARLTPEAQP